MDTNNTAPAPRSARRALAVLAAMISAAFLAGGLAPARADALGPFPPLSECLLNPLHGLNFARTAETINAAFGTGRVSLAEFRVAPVGTDIQLGAGAGDSVPSLGHSLKVTGLTPGTTFNYRIVTKDDRGKLCKREGQVSTKKRHVTVTLKKIHIIDDGDMAGDGEAMVHVKIGGKIRPGYYPDVDISPGDVLNPNFSHTVTNNKTFGIAVEIREDDSECFPICTLPTGGTAPSWGTGSNSDADWSTAKHTISVDSLPDATTTWNGEMSTPPSSLFFTVEYEVKVNVFD